MTIIGSRQHLTDPGRSGPFTVTTWAASQGSASLFWSPVATICDISFIHSLLDRMWLSFRTAEKCLKNLNLNHITGVEETLCNIPRRASHRVTLGLALLHGGGRQRPANYRRRDQFVTVRATTINLGREGNGSADSEEGTGFQLLGKWSRWIWARSARQGPIRLI